MDYLITKVSGMVIKPPITGDDIVDRMHYFGTVSIMVAFAVISALQEFVGSPINCWTPPEFQADSNSYFDHINSYCWTQKLRYPIYQDGSVVTNTSQGTSDVSNTHGRSDNRMALLKWVTPLFIIQACLFKFPNFLWHRLNTSSGADLQKIRDLALEAQSAKNNDTKKLKMDEMVAYFEDWVTGYRSYRIRLVGKQSAKLVTVLFCLGKKSGSYLSSLYLSIKLLNILNVLLNFVLLTVILDFSFWNYGITVLSSDTKKGGWQDSNNFPSLLLCDFVLEGGKESNDAQPTHEKYQVQCLMILNRLLEKIFAIEWFWLAFLLIVTLVNMIFWAVRIKPPCSTIVFSKAYMKILKSCQTTENESSARNSLPCSPETFSNNIKSFMQDYLRSDGVFVLKLLEKNANKALVADMVKYLWIRYRIMNNCKLPRYSQDGSNNNNSSNNNNNNNNNNDYSGPMKVQPDEDEPIVIVTDSML